MKHPSTTTTRPKLRHPFLLTTAGLVALVITLLPSCLKIPDSPLRAGILDWPPYNMAPLAARLGFIDSERIQMVSFQSPAEATRAYLAGGIDMVAVTLDFAIDFHRSDSEHQVFLLVDESLGGDSVISHDPYSSLSQLAGKRIGLEASALGAHMLHSLLKKAGLEKSDIETSFFDMPDHVDAFLDKKVDVIITYEPYRTTLLDVGGYEIFSSREIKGEIIDVFVARRGQIQKRLQDFRHFSEGWFKAVEEYRKDPEEIARITVSSGAYTQKEFLNGLSGVRMYTLEDNLRLLKTELASFKVAIAPFFDSLRVRDPTLGPDSLSDLTTGIALPRSLQDSP